MLQSSDLARPLIVWVVVSPPLLKTNKQQLFCYTAKESLMNVETSTLSVGGPSVLLWERISVHGLGMFSGMGVDFFFKSFYLSLD